MDLHRRRRRERLQPENNTYRWYRHEEGKNSISHNNVKAIYYDRTEEIMWIGTHLGGLNKLDLRTNRFTVYRMKAGDPTTLPSDIVRDIVPYEDKLIIATQTESAFSIRQQAPANIFSRIPKKAEISVWWPASTSTRTKR